MTNKIRHLRTSTPEKIPTEDQMDLGQFAINSADGKVFIKKTDGTIKDITNNIFKNDTNISVTDSVDGSFNNLDTGEITATVDGKTNIRIVKDQIEFKEKITLDNEKELRFYENLTNGSNYVSFKSPSNLVNSYTLTLPTANASSVGKLLGNDGLGNLGWYDFDSFGGNRIYVSADKGNDNNDGLTAPVKTIKKALQIASSKVYDGSGIPNGQRWNITVTSGNYYEDNPIIVPDNVSVTGDSLRSCILRPLNSGKDMLRVRNGCYFTEFTFRDALAGQGILGAPVFTWDYALAFDDPLDTNTSRVGYTNLPTTKPIISTSPYIQNCSIISFLGGNGALVDGSKVFTPNTPPNTIEVENPVNVSDGIPEQGKSMVANAFTMLSFGGTGWRIINDAYVQIVSCFQIFMLNGTYTQSGGYCSVTNSATNFGLYALRSSGFSPNAFTFDRGYIATTGSNNNNQTITAFGFTRQNGPVNEFIIRIYDPNTNADLTDSTFKNQLGSYSQVNFDAAIDVTVGTPGVFNITSHGYVNGEQITYYANNGTVIGGLFNGDSYFVQIIDADSFRLAFDDSFTRFVSITSVGAGSQFFRKNDYELIVGDVIDSHNVFQNLTLTPGSYAFTPGDVIGGQDTQPPGNPHNGYVYSYDPATYTLVVVVNKVVVNNFEQRILFASTSNITSINNIVLGSPIALTGVSSRTDLWLGTFEVLPTFTGGQFSNLGSMPGKKIWFHRPSITNSSAHTWEYAGSGIDYNALPQNGGKGDERYEQVSEKAGQVYTSGTNELGDFKVGDFIRAFNRTGNVVFNNKVTIDQLDVLKLALSDIEVTAISTDPDLGENELNGPSHSRISTQLAVWNYANNRLGPFIDKSVSTNAVPGNIVQLNANGQINRDLIPSQRSFNNFISLGYRSRLGLTEDIPTNEAISGDICSEKYEQVILTLDNPVTVEEGWLVTQATTNATGYITSSVTNGSTIVVASLYETFENILFNTTNNLTINGDSTPGVGNLTVVPTNVTTAVSNVGNYLITSSSSSQYLITNNIVSFTYTNVNLSSAIRYNNVAYIITAAAHNLNTDNKVAVENDNFNQIGYITRINSTAFSIPNINSNTASTGSTTPTATINAATNSTTTTGSVSDAALTGTIAVNDWVFGGGLPLGSRITAVNLSGDPNTFTVTFPSSSTVTATSTASLTFISPAAATGKVRSVITAADNLASGKFDQVKSGIVTSVNNLTYNKGSGYTTGIYLRVPLTNGSGTGALANITVSNGQIADVDVYRGGINYQVGDTLSVNSANVGGTGSGFSIPVTTIEQRIYLDLVGGLLFVASSDAADYIEDNNSLTSTITSTTIITKTFNAEPVAQGGDVDYVTDQITITNHGLGNGDPVEYTSAPNIAIGGMTSLDVYYVKSINANTIELYEDYNLLTKVNFGTSSTGNHTLTVYAVNLTDNSLYVPAHGLVAGDAVRLRGADLPSYDVEGTDVQILDNSYFFVGSVTTNSFTLHQLRTEALASNNGLVTNSYDLTIRGTGTIKFIKNNIAAIGVVNTSSTIAENWSILAADNIDAGNIVSGIISSSRLAIGSATDETFLRGDSNWVPAVQSIEYEDANGNSTIGTGNVVTLTGTISGISGTTNDTSGFVKIDIQRANQQSGQNFSTLGVASFKKTHFVVGSDATQLGGTNEAITGLTDGMVYIRAANEGGDVDAYTVSGFTKEDLTNSDNHSIQSVGTGGTGFSAYEIGDILYASAGPVNSALSKLAISLENDVLTSNGTAPSWKPELILSKNISTNSGTITTSSTTYGSLFDQNIRNLTVGNSATDIILGSTDASQTLTSNVSSYTTGGVSNTTVIANIGTSTVIATTVDTPVSATEINFASTAGIKIGQVLSGTNITANTVVIGLNSTRVYISNAPTAIIVAGTNITFTDTNKSLGINVGSQITITGEIANLNGTWIVTAAGQTGTTFSFIINSAVTLSNAARAGTIIKASNFLIRNRSLTFGGPTVGVLKSQDAPGSSNASGASLTINSGLSRGNATGAVINFATSVPTSSGSILQSLATRMTLNQSAATTLDLSTTMSSAFIFNTNATTVSAFGNATNITFSNTTGITKIRNSLEVDGTNSFTLSSVSITSNAGQFTCSSTFIKVGDTVTVTGTPSGTGAISGYTSGNVYYISVTNGGTSFTLSLSVGGSGIFTTAGTTTGLTFTVNRGAIVIDRDQGITTTVSTINLLNHTATTVNAFGDATAVNIGATTGTTRIKNNLSVDADVEIKGGDLTTNQTSFNLLNTTAETVNAFGAATTLNIGATTGTTTVKNNLSVQGNITLSSLNLDGVALRNTGTLTTTSQTQTELFNFVAATYGSGKMLIQATQGAERQISQLLVVHNGTTASATEYGVIITNSRLFTVDVDISGANVRVLVTSSSSTSTVYKVEYTLLAA